MSFSSRFAYWLLSKASPHLESELRRVGPGRPIWTPLDYEKLAEEGYEKNPIVTSVIDGIVDRFAALTFFVARGTGKDMEDAGDHPALHLLKRPNPSMSGYEYREAWGKYLLISGNSYVYSPLRESAGGPQRPAGDPLELWPWRPDKVEIIAGNAAEPVSGYRYDKGPDVPEEKISHAKLFNPRDAFYGLSPLHAAAMEVDQHNAASVWNASVLQNRGVIDTWINMKGGASTDDKDALRLALDDYAMPRFGARKPFVTRASEGIDVHRFGSTAVELDYLEGKKLSAIEICSAYKWPAQLAGIPGSLTYANFEQAEKTGYTQAVIPLAIRFCDAMTRSLIDRGGDGDLYLWFDLSGISCLQQDRTPLYEQAGTGFTSGFMDRAQAQEHVGLTPGTDEEGVYVFDAQRSAGRPDESKHGGLEAWRTNERKRLRDFTIPALNHGVL